jgi:hypothetical protein
MRSDYIGDCARYSGLPEAVTNALYLIPRIGVDVCDIEPKAVGRIIIYVGGLHECLVGGVVPHEQLKASIGVRVPESRHCSGQAGCAVPHEG